MNAIQRSKVVLVQESSMFLARLVPQGLKLRHGSNLSLKQLGEELRFYQVIGGRNSETVCHRNQASLRMMLSQANYDVVGTLVGSTFAASPKLVWIDDDEMIYAVVVDESTEEVLGENSIILYLGLSFTPSKDPEQTHYYPAKQLHEKTRQLRRKYYILGIAHYANGGRIVSF